MENTMTISKEAHDEMIDKMCAGESDLAAAYIRFMDKFMMVYNTHIGIAKDMAKIAAVYEAAYKDSGCDMEKLQEKMDEMKEKIAAYHVRQPSLQDIPDWLAGIEEKEIMLQSSYLGIILELAGSAADN